MTGKPEKSQPSPEEEDTSAFGGEPYVSQEKNRSFLEKKTELFEKYGMTKDRRLEMGKKLFGGSGDFITKEEARDAKRQLEDGKWGRYKDFTYEEKKDAMRVLKKVLGE